MKIVRRHQKSSARHRLTIGSIVAVVRKLGETKETSGKVLVILYRVNLLYLQLQTKVIGRVESRRVLQLVHLLSDRLIRMKRHTDCHTFTEELFVVVGYRLERYRCQLRHRHHGKSNVKADAFDERLHVIRFVLVGERFLL